MGDMAATPVLNIPSSILNYTFFFYEKIKYIEFVLGVSGSSENIVQLRN